MKISGNLTASKDQNNVAVAIEMTDEIREKWASISASIINLLLEKCDNPIEARMILTHLMNSFDDIFGVKAITVIDKNDARH